MFMVLKIFSYSEQNRTRTVGVAVAAPAFLFNKLSKVFFSLGLQLKLSGSFILLFRRHHSESQITPTSSSYKNINKRLYW